MVELEDELAAEPSEVFAEALSLVEPESVLALAESLLSADPALDSPSTLIGGSEVDPFPPRKSVTYQPVPLS